MKTCKTDQIRITFQEIADMVTPTMGAKGRMAVLNDEFSRPILTDDGVTVAKEAFGMQGFERMIAISMIEAANNTEKKAFDGTTLTILLTNEFYKQGLSWIKRGMHPQQAADNLLWHVNKVRFKLKDYRIPLNQKLVKDLALITTKIQAVSELVYQAYVASNQTMNVVIEHDRKESESSVEFTDGMVLPAGYFTEQLKQLCNEGDQTIYEHAHLVLLAEEILTQQDLSDLFRSIPDHNVQDPFIFFVTKAFNPEVLKQLLDTLVANKMRFQLVFINDARPDEIFLDLAAYTGGKVQDAAFGTSGYRFEDCGFADKIVIEQDKTIITIGNSKTDGHQIQIDKRIQTYKKELEDYMYNTGMNRAAAITSRLANLESGVTKIKVAVPTITEYLTLKLKLDDALGAVKCAISNGVVMGGGKVLWNIANEIPELKRPLQSPLRTIIKNAGLRVPKEVQKVSHLGLDVRTNMVVDLLQAGIVDSYDSIDSSLTNAVSIAANYLRAYILIKKD
jgi:chaperonin GroEL